MVALNQEQSNITRRNVIIWENPYSQIDEWEKRIQQKKEKDCQARFTHACWDLEEQDENMKLKAKIENGEVNRLNTKEIKVLETVEKGNQHGDQIGNYGLCVKKAREAWRRQIVIKENFFMPFENEECSKEFNRESKKIYVVMYHEAVEGEYSHTSVEAVFNTEKAARHWIAAKIKREAKNKRQTREFVRKGGDERNLPYGKEYHHSIWQDIWYTVEEKKLFS